MKRPGWRATVAILGAAAVLALVHLTQTALTSQARSIAFDTRRQALSEASFWGAWAIVGLCTVFALGGLSTAAGRLRIVATWLGVLLATLVFQPVIHAFAGIALGIFDQEHAFLVMEKNWLLNTMSNLQIAIGLLGIVTATGVYARYRERDEAARVLEGQLATARLEVLRAQLDPHFLFNSMNAIAMLARRGATADVVRMVTGLSDFLRDTLDEARPQLVPLSRELEFVQRYLDIEQVRFQDRLSVVISASDDASSATIPTFILQPLVENAVRHGVTGEGRARVEISAVVSNGRLTVCVRDHGVGAPHESNGSRGLGLRNSRARLREIYGNEASLTLSTHPEGGAIARLDVPATPTSFPYERHATAR